MRELHAKYRDSIHPGLPLPLEYDMALGALELFLVNQVIYRIACLRYHVVQAPGFQQHWKLREASEDPKRKWAAERRTTKLKHMLAEDPLDWCLVEMLELPDDQDNLDHAFLFAFLESHLSKSSKQENARIDGLLMQKLSNLSASHEALMCVRLHRPRNKARAYKDVTVSEDREAWRRLASEPIRPSDQGLQRAGNLLLQKFYRSNTLSDSRSPARPKSQRVSLVIVKKFWEAMHDIINTDFAPSKLSKKEVLNLLEVIEATNTAEYMDLITKEEKAQALAKEQQVRLMTASRAILSLPQSMLRLGWLPLLGIDIRLDPTKLSKRTRRAKPLSNLRRNPHLHNRSLCLNEH